MARVITCDKCQREIRGVYFTIGMFGLAQPEHQDRQILGDFCSAQCLLKQVESAVNHPAFSVTRSLVEDRPTEREQYEASLDDVEPPAECAEAM